MSHLGRLIKILVRYYKGRVTIPLAHYLLEPLQAQFIAAYPRSGSTWLRTMVVNVLYPDTHSNPEIFNKVIPGSTLTRVFTAYNSPTPHILSTHSKYLPTIKRAVYLIRDGRHSVTSFYRYTTSREGINLSFSKWLDYYSKGLFGPRWDQNTISWLNKGCQEMKENLLVEKYEDFLIDPISELGKVCNFLNISFTNEDLIRSVDASTINKMREWERKLGGEITDPNASFYRGGKTNEWEHLLTEEDKERFMQISSAALQLGGYV